MKSSKALRVLAELSASQWGMVTTAQAATHGVERLDLSRLAKAGHLERLAHGVYRDAGAPADEFEELRAAWLAADPSRTSEARLRDLVSGIVVMGESAASLHGVGDLPADRHELSSPVRRQTQRSEISYRQRQLHPDDVTIARGLPVTTIERTIADLTEARTDLSLVADVLRDAARVRDLDTDRLADLLGPLATRNGHHKNDGAALLNHLATLAGLDVASLAAAIGTSKRLSSLIAANSLARFNTSDLSNTLTGPATQQALAAMNQSIARSLEESMAPALEAISASIAASPAMVELQEKLAQISKQVAQNLPTQDLLASFGKDWAAALIATTDTSRTDALRTLRSSSAVEIAELAGIGG
ncbi:MAG: type IV toxin-antitoxin system AbiEi family antitoxin domain-containing protein [Microthrixaceae bacterium]